MKRLELTKEKRPIGDYMADAREGPILLTRKGKTVGALLAVDDGDLERAKLSTDPWFIAIIERARAQVRAGQVLTTEEVRRELGIPAHRAVARTRRRKAKTA